VTADSPRRAMALLALFALAWVLLEEVLGRLLRQPYPLLQVVWCRYAAHLGLVLVIFGWRQPSHLWRTARLRFHLLRSMCMLVMPLGFVMSVGAGAPSGFVWSIFWVAPVLVLLIARRWLSEPLPDAQARTARQVQWVSLACTIAAALLLWPRPWPDPFTAAALPLSSVWALAMTVSFALYVVMTRSLRTEALQANLFYTAVGVFALLTPLMPSIWVMPTAHDAAVLFGIGALGLVCLVALDRAAAAAPLALSAPGLYAFLPSLALVGYLLQDGLHAGASVRRLLVVAAITVALAYLWHRMPRLAAQPVLPG
jgi:drug/metabolite transporter (DMT)-like permease